MISSRRKQFRLSMFWFAWSGPNEPQGKYIKVSKSCASVHDKNKINRSLDIN